MALADGGQGSALAAHLKYPFVLTHGLTVQVYTPTSSKYILVYTPVCAHSTHPHLSQHRLHIPTGEHTSRCWHTHISTYCCPQQCTHTGLLTAHTAAHTHANGSAQCMHVLHSPRAYAHLKQCVHTYACRGCSQWVCTRSPAHTHAMHSPLLVCTNACILRHSACTHVVLTQ